MLAGITFLDPAALFAHGAWAPTSVKAFPLEKSVLGKPLTATENVHIVVALKLRNKSALDAAVASIVRRGRGRKALTYDAATVRDQFAPTADQAASVARYLAKSGFTGIRISPNNLLVDASGTARSVQAAFNTGLVHVRRGKDYGIVNVEPVQVPSDLAGAIESVVGLQTVGKLQTFDIMHWPCPLCGGGGGGGGPPTGILIPQLATLYNATSLPVASNVATAVIADGSMAQVLSDFATFESHYGYPALTPSIVYAGTQGGDTLNVPEWDIDSQIELGVAGGSLKSLTFYVASAFTDADFVLAYNAAVSADVAKVINISFGECDADAYSDGTMAASDPVFEMAVAQGQTFTVATGDSGSNPCGGSSPSLAYPASSPYVIAVGGTSLTVTNGSYGGETAWSGGGGGSSAYETQPSWQTGIVPGTMRGIPDVAFEASPSPGIQAIFYGSLYGPVGGTSIAAPNFAGLLARFQAATNNSLPFPAQWIYHYPVNGRALAFHDVTSGSNGAYSATTGWDYTTGFGSMNAANIPPGLALIPLPPITAYLLNNPALR